MKRMIKEEENVKERCDMSMNDFELQQKASLKIQSDIDSMQEIVGHGKKTNDLKWLIAKRQNRNHSNYESINYNTEDTPS